MNRAGQPCRTCQKPLQPRTEKKHGQVIQRRNRGAGFCSLTCWYTYSRIVKQLKRKVSVCRICGSEFTKPGKTCSAACGYKFRKQFTTKRFIASCLECGNTFRGQTRKNKFCSPDCYRVYSKAMVERKCEICGRIFKRTWGALKRVKVATCSRACTNEAHSGERHPHWRGGHDPNRGSSWLRIAEEVRRRDGYRCRRCRKTQEENKQKLSVDHIMPWRLFESAEEANQLKNLAALCRACHSWKTSVAEKQMLIGDNMNFAQYLRSLDLE